MLVVLAACGSFQDPDIVQDLRIVGAQATPVEQLVDVDPANPQVTPAILDQLAPVTVCARVADPAVDERLRYTATMCPWTVEERCATSAPAIVIGSGTIDDPDTTVPAPALCATVQPDGNFLGVLVATLQADLVGGLAGLDVEVELRVGPADGDGTADVFGSKIVRVSPRIPAARTANRNPTLDAIHAVIGHVPGVDDPPAVELPRGRCVDQATPVEVPAGTRVRLTPIEAADARETYVVPTLDGKTEMFTEALTYEWLATSGHFSAGSTGGPRDLAGNPAPLFTDWTAPTTIYGTETPLPGPTDVSIWVVQRDERLGSQLHELCVRVVP